MALTEEGVLKLPKPAGAVRDRMVELGVLAGLPLGQFYVGRDNQLLVCATEKRTEADIRRFADALKEAIA